MASVVVVFVLAVLLLDVFSVLHLTLLLRQLGLLLALVLVLVGGWPVWKMWRG